MEPSAQAPKKGTLLAVRRLGIAASLLALAGFLLAIVVIIIPFELEYRFEIVYAGAGAIALGFISLAALTVFLRVSVPMDKATKRKIVQYYWSVGPVGLLLSILMLTDSRRAPTSGDDREKLTPSATD